MTLENTEMQTFCKTAAYIWKRKQKTKQKQKTNLSKGGKKKPYLSINKLALNPHQRARNIGYAL